MSMYARLPLIVDLSNLNLWLIPNGGSGSDARGSRSRNSDDGFDFARQVFSQVYDDTQYLEDPAFYAEWYGASALAGASGAVAADLAAGEWDSLLFGRGGVDYGGLLNSNSVLRIGFGWNGTQAVFRIGGNLLEWMGMDNPHIDLWPPSSW